MSDDILTRLREPARLNASLGGTLPRSILDEAADEIERLRTAVAAEREACAKVARTMGIVHAHRVEGGEEMADLIENAIRTRGGE